VLHDLAMTRRVVVLAVCATAVGCLAPGAGASKPRPLVLRWLHMIDRSHGYAVSGLDTRGYRLLRTDDGGRHWADITPGNGTIHPSGAATVSGRTILFGTQRGAHTFAVERSDDGGRAWRMSQIFRDSHPAGIGPPELLDSTHLYLAMGEGAAAGSEAESLWTSSDGGRTWQFVSRTDFTSSRRGQLPFGCDKDGYGFATMRRGWAGGFCPGGKPFLYRTDDGGRTWRRASLPEPRACACTVSAPTFFGGGGGVMFVYGWGVAGTTPVTLVYWTADGGAHWRVGTPTSGLSGPAASFPSAQIAWVAAAAPGLHRVGPFDRLLRTTDAGRSWQSIPLPFDAGQYHLDALDGTTAFAYAERRILTTTDGGRHWQGLPAGTTCPLVPQPVHGSNPLARTVLVPPAASSLVLCRYAGLNAGSRSGGQLVAATRTTDGATVVHLTNELDALRALPKGISCPFDDGSDILAVFRYRHAVSNAVRISLRGCHAAANGHLIRYAGPAVTAQLERMLRPAGPPAPCTGAQLGVAARTQGENTTAWIGVWVRNRGRACVATDVPVTIAVAGSRLTMHASGRLDHGGSQLLVADWSNWCGTRAGVHVVATAGDAEAVVPVRPLPLCLQRGQRSRLLAVH
jgi:photosystem II stability/assembly factor-like uncharacterized protein